MGSPDRHLLRYLAHELLVGLRDLGRFGVYPRCLAPGELLFDRAFRLRVGFLKVG